MALCLSTVASFLQSKDPLTKEHLPVLISHRLYMAPIRQEALLHYNILPGVINEPDDLGRSYGLRLC